MARVYDLYFQSLPLEEAATSLKVFTLGKAAEGSQGTKGFQLCINMWVKILFTRKGSDPTNLSRGTAFPNLSGSNLSMVDAEDVVRSSIDEASEQLTAIQTKDASFEARERLASAQLLSYVPDPSGPGYEAWVEILNQAGERLVINMPDFIRRA